MRKMLRKTMTLALSAVLAMQVFAVGASAELFIDNPVETDGKTSVKVANYTDKAQKVRLYTASFSGTTLNDVDASEIVEIAAGGSAELTTDITGVNYFWSDALVPYNEDAVALATPTGMTAPASRDSADNHRTMAYNSFLLEWDLDTTGVVDHYEVYEGETKIGETENGYYIVYTEDVNEDSKNYSVKAVTAGGKTSDASIAVSAGSLYMNEIDFSNMTVATAETSFDVTYPWIDQHNKTVTYNEKEYKIWTKEAAKYGTEEDVKLSKGIWIDESSTSYPGIESTGMKVHFGKWETDRYVAPALVPEDSDTGREARGAFKTYYSYNWSANSSTAVGEANVERAYDGGRLNNMFFTVDDTLLTENGEVQDNVSFAWDYFDNGNEEIEGRFPRSTGGTEYVGVDTVKNGSLTWKTSQNSVTNYTANTKYSAVEGENPAFKIAVNSNVVPTSTASKMYISGARVWLTNRGSDKAFDNSNRIQMANAEYDNLDGVNVESGVKTVNVSGSRQRNGESGAGTGRCWMTGKNSTDEIGFMVENKYLGAYDKKVTISVDYYYAAPSSKEPTKAIFTYDRGTAEDGTYETELVTGWNTVTFKLSDAGFANGVSTENCDFTVKLDGDFITPGSDAPQLYIKNIRVYPSHNVKEAK